MPAHMRVPRPELSGRANEYSAIPQQRAYLPSATRDPPAQSTSQGAARPKIESTSNRSNNECAPQTQAAAGEFERYPPASLNSLAPLLESLPGRLRWERKRYLQKTGRVAAADFHGSRLSSALFARVALPSPQSHAN